MSDVVRAQKTVPAGAWVASTYFAQGYPYAIVINLADLFFVAHGASLQAVGLTSLFHLPWNLKAFVGPFLDAYATKRSWLVAIELLLSIALVAFAFATTLPNVLVAASVVFIGLAILSATHDIAIDGLYLEVLDKKQQEALVGWRAPPWRLALMLVTGPMAIVCDKQGWLLGGLVLAGAMFALFLFHLVFLPRTETQKKPAIELLKQAFTLRFLAIATVIAVVIAGGRALLRSDTLASIKGSAAASFPKAAVVVGKWGPADWIGMVMLVALIVGVALLPKIRRRIEGSTSTYAASFASFLAQPYAGRILAYIVLFRIGESFLMKMKTPFSLKALGLTVAEYGVVNGTIGMIVGLAAPVIGGVLIAKVGFRKCIWPFLLAQNGLHLVFCLAAIWAPEIATAKTPLLATIVGPHVVTMVDTRLVVVTAVIVIEIIGAGLGTAAFMVYIIRCCSPDHKAAHMALLTSLMSISFTLAGVFSGFLAEALGFPWYFFFTFIVTMPGMALTLWVPHIDERGAKPTLGR